MRAVAIRQYGGPEVLEVADLPSPEPGPSEVRVRVSAATVNPTDIGMRAGRQAATLDALPAPYVPGMELAGTVDGVGPGAPWRIGDRVLGIALPMRTGRGAQAEQVVVPADSVVAIPPGISFAEAATLPMNGLTARRALDLLELQPGQTLAVTGAAGAVGAYVVQLAAAEGVRVIGVASAADESFVREIGAAACIDRATDVVAQIRRQAPGGVDAVVDAAVVGQAMLPAVRDGGKVAAVRGFEGQPERGITVIQVRVSDYAHNQAALARLADAAAGGRLALRVAETLPPQRAADAHRRLEAGGLRGRLVISFE